jgi:hypothetical protein
MASLSHGTLKIRVFWLCPSMVLLMLLAVLSTGGSEEQIHHGLAIGLERKGNPPVILVHLSAARAEGADLDAGLLSLSRLIETGRGER